MLTIRKEQPPLPSRSESAVNFWDIILSIFWFMLLFAWIWLLITIFADLFRRDDTSGWAKAGWIVLLIVLPFI